MTDLSCPTAIRGCAVTFRANPFQGVPQESMLIEEDALIVMDGGKVVSFGSYEATRHVLPAGVVPVRYENCLISAGFIDTHVHYPQLPVIAAWGEQLMEWLETYVFPAEARFADEAHAAATARFFLKELMRSGTTTAAVYCTVHPQSVDAFFAESERLGTLMIAGKVLMDRNAPDDLRDTVRQGYEDSAALIARWHGNGRQLYAVTPRFAITSTPEQLESAGDLLDRDASLYIQTHLAENHAEIAAVHHLFPDAPTYLGVYDAARLVRPRSVFGHAIHVGEGEFCRCHESGAALAHCPTSNLFLGSGAFRLFDALDAKRPVRVGLGSDVGAGTSLSQLKTMAEAYKVAQMTGHRLHPAQALWLATAGGAQALRLEDRIGTIAPGMEADLCVIDLHATPLLRYRMEQCERIEDTLFPLMILGDDRCIRATWVAGQRVYDRDGGQA